MAGRGEARASAQASSGMILVESRVIAEFTGATNDEKARTVAADAAGLASVTQRTWRILSTGAVQWSSIAGVWNSVDVPPGVAAGSAPSPSVCWLVGRAGLVLLTVDGSNFGRVRFPVSVDLIAVRTPSANQAIVTASDGRVFVTLDAGQTWRAGLQENPSPSF
jgi:photosystem II stability/assembly factor-like uncharacterized protein